MTKAYLYFSYYKYLAQCLYAEIKPRCSQPAAEYIVTFLLDGWKPHLYSRYQCQLGTLIFVYHKISM